MLEREYTSAENLKWEMWQQDLNPSALARKVYGTTKNRRGNDVAKNRDYVGQWLKGRLPELENREKVAVALGVPAETIWPEIVMQTRLTGPVAPKDDRNGGRKQLERDISEIKETLKRLEALLSSE